MNKISFFKTMKASLYSFKTNLKEIIIFEMAYRLITAFILIPLNMLLLKYLIEKSGFNIISNKEILNFTLSFKGIVSIGILLIISFLMIFFEIGVLTYIGVKSYKREKVRIIEGAKNSFAILKDTIGFSIIPLIIMTGVVGPWFSMGLCSSLIREFTIPPFITIELNKTLGGKIFYGIIIVILILLLLRWILAIPTIAVEKVRGKKALKKSYKMYKKNRFGLLKAIILWEVLIGVLTTLILGFITVLGMGVGNFLGNTTIKSKIFLIIMILIFFIVFMTINLLYTGLFTQFLVQIYYELRDDDIEERRFIEKIDYSKNKKYRRVNKGSKVIAILIVVLFSLVSFYKLHQVMQKGFETEEVQITAHRGSSNAPENTLEAVNEAAKEGADYAEIDVMTTKDNKVVLFHDKTLKRIDGTNRKIKDMTLKEVEEVDAGSYYSEKYKGAKIPTLEEVLKESKGKIKLNIELKPMKENDPLVKEVVDLVKKYNMENDVVISSINYDALMETEKLNSELKTGYVLLAMMGNVDFLNVDFVSLESSLAKRGTVYALNALGKDVHVFTVNNENLCEKLMFNGVDNIITDNVPLIKKTEEKLKKEDKRDYVTIYYENILSIINNINI